MAFTPHPEARPPFVLRGVDDCPRFDTCSAVLTGARGIDAAQQALLARVLEGTFSPGAWHVERRVPAAAELWLRQDLDPEDLESEDPEWTWTIVVPRDLKADEWQSALEQVGSRLDLGGRWSFTLSSSESAGEKPRTTRSRQGPARLSVAGSERDIRAFWKRRRLPLDGGSSLPRGSSGPQARLETRELCVPLLKC